MRVYKYIFPLVLFTASCTEKIDLELDSTYTRLVVYGTITTDTMSHRVELSKSADYFFNQAPEKVIGAMVELRFDDTVIKLNENTDLPGIYETAPDFSGIPGKTYHLTINGVDINQDGLFEKYTASSYLPEVNSIDSITLKYTFNSFFSGWEVQIWTYDPADKRNFYVFKTLINNRLVTDTLTELVIQNDDFFNGSFTNGITAQFLLESKPDEKLNYGDTVTFEINGITQDYFNFLFEAQSESFGQNPLFSGPPANISSNISNGALGYFTAYSIERASRVVMDPYAEGAP